MQKNLTKGSVLKNTVYFSLPYLLSYFLQTLYGMADLFIVGINGDVAATTAVSVGSQVMHMLTVITVGLAMGTTVCTSRAVGGDDRNALERYVGNTVTLFGAFAVILTVVLVLLVRPITDAVSTPREAFDGTVQYLTICFCGIPFIVAYNIICAVFRGMGDSKSPMYFVAIACAANIVLDCVFILVFEMGAAGAALGTVAAQAISAIAACIYMVKRKSGIRFTPRLERKYIGEILSGGVPIAVQDGLIQIAFIVITVITNRRGLTDAAAVGIVEKIIGFLFLVPSSMLSAVSALGAQNIGAGKPWRAVQTLKYAVVITVLFGIFVTLLTQLAAENAVSLFTSDNAVIVAGGQYLCGYIFDCIFAGIHFSFSGYFCACGKSWISFLHNITAIIVARIPLVYLMSEMFPATLLPMGVATATGSAVSVIICIAAFAVLRKKVGKIQNATV